MTEKNYDLPCPTPGGGIESWFRLRTGRFHSMLVRVRLEDRIFSVFDEDGAVVVSASVSDIARVVSNSLRLGVLVPGHSRELQLIAEVSGGIDEGAPIIRRGLVEAWAERLAYEMQNRD